MLTITLIAAVSEDGYISRGTGIPWHLPADIALFRAATAGQWLLLGRKTYEEMLGWFSDHTPLVLSRDIAFQPRLGHRVGTVEEAIVLAEAAGQTELVVCGGGAVYAAAMPFATRLVITRVGTALGGGVAFPAVDACEWNKVAECSHPADAQHEYPFCMTTYERRYSNTLSRRALAAQPLCSIARR